MRTFCTAVWRSNGGVGCLASIGTPMNLRYVRVESNGEFDPHAQGYGIAMPSTKKTGIRKKVKMAVIIRMMPSTFGFILP